MEISRNPGSSAKPAMILSNKQPIKRLVVRNFKGQKLPEDFEMTSWELLRQGIAAILNGEQPASCLEILYKTCENMVRCNLGNNLYSKVYESIELFNKTFADNKCSGIAVEKGFELLSGVSAMWTTYCGRLQLLENVLMYLDRCFVLNRTELNSIHELGVAMFRSYSLEASGLFGLVKETLLAEILAIRQKQSLGDLSLHRSLVEMLVDTGLFGQFEAVLINSTTDQFENIVQAHQFGTCEHVELVAFYLFFEERLGEQLGYPKETQAKLVKIAEQIILQRHLDSLVASGLPLLVEASWNDAVKPEVVEPPMNDFGELQRGQSATFELNLLVKLAVRSNGLDVLKLNWSKFIKAYGSTLIAANKELSMIEDVLLFKSRLEKILADILGGDQVMENALRESFESFINARASRFTDLLVRYLDSLLRDGKKSRSSDRLPDDQLRKAIDDAFVLFRYLQNKEAVESLYKQYLAKRLLQNRSLSMEGEKEVVQKFKAECGASFTSRLEGMFKDVEATPEVNRQFKEACDLKDLPYEFSVTVISSGIWPHPEDVKVKIPKDVVQAQQSFEAFYDSKHNGRLLAWNQSMGFCVIKAPFPQGTKELQVSVPQAMVLECFNASEKLNVAELAKQTKLDIEQLHYALQTLSTGRHQILINESGNEGNPQKSDVFAYNAGFTSRLVRIRLNSSATAELVEEKASGSALLHLEDKQHRIDAAIVRTIKAARRMTRTALVEQAIGALKLGSLPKAEVEKRIDLLMTRDFITKDADDVASLIYVP